MTITESGWQSEKLCRCSFSKFGHRRGNPFNVTADAFGNIYTNADVIGGGSSGTAGSVFVLTVEVFV